jgi:hypothetical protein
MYSQDYKGLFHGPFVLQTFAAHFTAIVGAVKVPSIGSGASPSKQPTAALAMSAAAVCSISAASDRSIHNFDRLNAHLRCGPPEP